MKVFDVRDFGAVGDGVTLNTQAIQKAIDQCASENGGRVILSDGRYVSGTIFIRSHVELCIEANAALVASESGEDYPDFACEQWNVKAAPRASAKCLIYFGYIENASLSGMGTIDCRGESFCDPVYENGALVRYVRNTTDLPARMVFIMGCTNVRIEDITMKDMAGGWGYWVNNSQYVTFSKAKVYCNPLYPNADGIHINCSEDVLVDSCVVHSGDDSIVIRANTNTLTQKRVCERIIVKGCVLSSNCQAVRIAWRNDGTIRNCSLSDLVITNSRIGIVIELPDHSSPTDFGQNATIVENIHVNNVVLDEVEFAPIKVIVHPDNCMDRIRNIRFSNITSSSGDYPMVSGRSDAVIEEIYFNGCKFTVHEKREWPARAKQFFCNVRGLHLTDTTFDITE